MTYGDPTGTFFDNVHARASPFGQSFLRVGRKALTAELQQELNSPPPTNHNLCETAVVRWMERLNIIESALNNFPTVITRTPTSAPALARSAIGLIPQRAISAPHQAVQAVSRDPIAVQNCHKRDESECLVTGRNKWDGFAIEIAHIIPFALANQAGCRQMDFWRMLEFFWGVQYTNTLYDQISHEIDTTWNMVTLDNSIHAMWDKGAIILTPLTLNGVHINIGDVYFGSFDLEVSYPHPLRVPELIQSTKVIRQSAVCTLKEGSRVRVPRRLEFRNPRATYFTVRELIVRMKRECDESIGLQAIMQPPPLS